MAKIQHRPRTDIGQYREVVAQCPGCKALETVWLNSKELWPTQRFKMKRNGIYHDCGSDQACRLWRSW